MAPHSSIIAWKSHGWRSLVGYSPWGGKELDTTEWFHSLIHSAFPKWEGLLLTGSWEAKEDMVHKEMRAAVCEGDEESEWTASSYEGEQWEFSGVVLMDGINAFSNDLGEGTGFIMVKSADSKQCFRKKRPKGRTEWVPRSQRVIIRGTGRWWQNNQIYNSACGKAASKLWARLGHFHQFSLPEQAFGLNDFSIRQPLGKLYPCLETARRLPFY